MNGLDFYYSCCRPSSNVINVQAAAPPNVTLSNIIEPVDLSPFNTQASHDADIALLNTAINNIEGTISSLQADIASVEATISNLQATITALQANTAANSAAIAALQAAVAALQGQVLALQAQVSTLQGTLAALGATVAGLTASVTALGITQTAQGNDIASLQSTAANLETDVTQLGQFVNSNTSNIGFLLGRTTDQASNVDTIFTLLGTGSNLQFSGSNSTGLLTSNDWLRFDSNVIALNSLSNATALGFADASSNLTSLSNATALGFADASSNLASLSNATATGLADASSNLASLSNATALGFADASSNLASLSNGFTTGLADLSNAITWSNLVGRPAFLSGVASNDLTTFSSVTTGNLAASNATIASDLSVGNNIATPLLGATTINMTTLSGGTANIGTTNTTTLNATNVVGGNATFSNVTVTLPAPDGVLAARQMLATNAQVLEDLGVVGPINAFSDLNVFNQLRVEPTSAVPGIDMRTFVVGGQGSSINMVGGGGGGAWVGMTMSPFDNGATAQPSAIVRAVDNFFSANLELLVRPTGAGAITTPPNVIARFSPTGPEFPLLPTSGDPPNLSISPSGVVSRTTAGAGSISFLETSLGANTTITGTNTYNTGIPLFLTIPAGTWMITADVGVFIQTTNQSTVLFRLFNDTAGAEIPASVTSVTQADGSLFTSRLNRGCSTCIRVVTLGVTSVIRVQALASVGGSPQLLGNAVNGFSRMTAIRLA